MEHHRGMSVGFLTTNSNVERLAEQVRRVAPYGVAISDEKSARRFRELSDYKGTILSGPHALSEAAAYHQNDIVMSSLVGFSGVLPTLAAIRSGKTVALANKETLVSAGAIITRAARESGSAIIAVDSEHSAILQCLVGEDTQHIEKLIITASGGPLRTLGIDQLKDVSPTRALAHPNWSMGPKITIDSATLMNKGLEVIEAYWLFGVEAKDIEVLIHPQSIIHSMVQFVDGSVKAQLGLPDMKLPILYALEYPKRTKSSFQRMDLSKIATLSFELPDFEKFPCLQLAFDALECGGTATTVLNAANEIAVQAFLAGKIRFTAIARIIEEVRSTMQIVANPSLEDIIASDTEARIRASEVQSQLQSAGT
jgi:1-deoxy-D-xylulose-5-phosphate reductoisomerase